MKSRVLVITGCDECWHHMDNVDHNVCLHRTVLDASEGDERIYGRVIPDAPPIPDWCPLQDATVLEAAPDLLAACEAALPIVCSRIEYPGDPCEKIADGIRAAIAKARGEVCSFCGGTGAVDSGAPSPQGYFIDVPCPECDGTGDPRQRKEAQR